MSGGHGMTRMVVIPAQTAAMLSVKAAGSVHSVTELERFAADASGLTELEYHGVDVDALVRFATSPAPERIEGVTPGGIHWTSTAYHGKDRRR
jgi:hypothetical protein